MSANVPTDICFSFAGLRQRGGQAGPHRDGWGLAFYNGPSCQIFQESQPSADSQIAKFLQNYPIKSKIVLSHIRQANYGPVCLENTHPFQRELWGRFWTFAHNGQLKGIKQLKLQHYQPVGTTDSEYVFCWLLSEIRTRFPKRPKRQSTLNRFIKKLCLQLHDLGVFNLLLSDANNLYTFCGNHLSWITRRAPFGVATLKDADLSVNFNEETTPDDIVTIIATQPLTDNETWQIMSPGEFNVFNNGNIISKNG